MPPTPMDIVVVAAAAAVGGVVPAAPGVADVAVGMGFSVTELDTEDGSVRG